MQTLSVATLKQVSLLIDEAVVQCEEDAKKREFERNEALKEIGNLLHDSVIVSNDEVRN